MTYVSQPKTIKEYRFESTIEKKLARVTDKKWFPKPMAWKTKFWANNVYYITKELSFLTTIAHSLNLRDFSSYIHINYNF
jgi:hypothetical protein